MTVICFASLYYFLSISIEISYTFTFLCLSVSLSLSFYFVTSLLLYCRFCLDIVIRTEAWILERQRNYDVSSCNIKITQFFETHIYHFELDSLEKLFVAMNVMLFILMNIFIYINKFNSCWLYSLDTYIYMMLYDYYVRFALISSFLKWI